MFSLLRKRRAKRIIEKTAARRASSAHAAGRNAAARSTPIQHERWVKTDELKLGMYVAELNVPWEETGFMFQGFCIDSTRLLKQVQACADSALVRTQKVAFVSPTSRTRSCRDGRAAL